MTHIIGDSIGSFDFGTGDGSRSGIVDGVNFLIDVLANLTGGQSLIISILDNCSDGFLDVLTNILD